MKVTNEQLAEKIDALTKIVERNSRDIVELYKIINIGKGAAYCTEPIVIQVSSCKAPLEMGSASRRRSSKPLTSSSDSPITRKRAC